MLTAIAGTRRCACLLPIVLGAGAVLLLSTSSPAPAHGRLVKSDPAAGEMLAAAPASVTAWFSEELDTRKSRFTIAGPQGRSAKGGVDLFDPEHTSMVIRLDAQLPAGRYTVQWRAVSAEDGDATQGQFDFVITKEGDP